jgi:hypothetical protein
MKPIILFFEDHRDPIAKEILSQSLSALQAFQVNGIGLEIDRDTSIESHQAALLHYCKLWSKMNSLSIEEKDKILGSVSIERRDEFQQNISYLPARKAELGLILRAKLMEEPIKIEGFDLNLGEIRTLLPHQQLLAARSMQVDREKAMIHNLMELNAQSGVVAILGLSHYDVANQLKQQGHHVVCFLPVSIEHEEGICREYLDKIKRHDATVRELILLDKRVNSMSEILQIIASSIEPALAIVPSMR